MSDFESDAGGWKIRQGGQQARGKLSVDRSVAHCGVSSLRVDYEFSGEKEIEYVDIGGGMPIERDGLGVGFWVKGSGDPLSMRLRIRDRTGETHQPSLVALKGISWQYAAVTLGKSAGHWGGDNNGRLDYPCSLVSIVADRPKVGFNGKGTLWIDDVAIVHERAETRVLEIFSDIPKFGNLYRAGERVRLRVTGDADKVVWSARDYFGSEVAAGAGTLAGGYTIQFKPPTQGWFVCRLAATKQGKTVDCREYRLLSLPLASPENSFFINDGFVGVGCHFGQRHHPHGCMGLLADLGIRHFRDEISWRSVECEKGVLRLPEYADEYISRAVGDGLEPLIILDYANRFYDSNGFPNSPEAIAAFARYGATLANALKGRVEDYEVWNEWTIGCGMRDRPGSNSAEAYVPLLKSAYAAVKGAVSNVTVVGVGGEHSAHHFERIKTMMQRGAGKAMDAWSVHSYRYPESPEKSELVGEIRKVVDMAVSNGAPPRLWVTEIGWPTHSGGRGVDERTQARYIVRTMALLQSIPEVDRVYWYDLMDDGLQREYNEHNFGIVRHKKFNCAPKPALAALSVFARLTAGGPVGFNVTGERYEARYASDGGRGLAVIWRASGEETLKVPRDGVTVRDCMGNVIEGDVRLSEDPVYVEVADGRFDGLLPLDLSP